MKALNLMLEEAPNRYCPVNKLKILYNHKKISANLKVEEESKILIFNLSSKQIETIKRHANRKFNGELRTIKEKRTCSSWNVQCR